MLAIVNFLRQIKKAACAALVLAGSVLANLDCSLRVQLCKGLAHALGTSIRLGLGALVARPARSAVAIVQVYIEALDGVVDIGHDVVLSLCLCVYQCSTNEEEPARSDGHPTQELHNSYRAVLIKFTMIN